MWCVVIVLLQALLLDQEFEVLGEQLLTDLREKIYCMADHVPIGDFTQNPDHPSDITAKVWLLTRLLSLALISISPDASCGLTIFPSKSLDKILRRSFCNVM